MVSDSTTSVTAETTPSDTAAEKADSAVADFGELKHRLEELVCYLGHYMAVKRDRLFSKAQRGLVLLAGLAVAAVVVLAFFATGGALLCLGIALAINAATGSMWMGPLLTGLAVLLLMAAGTLLTMRRVDAMVKKRFSHACQIRRAKLRVRYGRGIDE